MSAERGVFDWIGNMFNEIGNRIKYSLSMTYRIFTSPFSALNVEAGIGIDFERKKRCGFGVKKSYTYSLALKEKEFDIKHKDSEELSFGVYNFKRGYSNGKPTLFI